VRWSEHVRNVYKLSASAWQVSSIPARLPLRRRRRRDVHESLRESIRDICPVCTSSESSPSAGLRPAPERHRFGGNDSHTLHKTIEKFTRFLRGSHHGPDVRLE
jgi:hypothetical protein